MTTGNKRVPWRLAAILACLVAVVALGVAAGRTNAADRSDTTNPAEPAEVELKIYRGAEVYGPFVPAVVNVDVRQLPRAVEWQPGDPIKEIPRRDKKRHDYVPPGPPVNPPTSSVDPLLARQTATPVPDSPRAFTTPDLNIPGQGFSGVNPPDPSGEVGKNYYIQLINSGSGARVAIFDKVTGTLAAAPFQLDSLGTGICSSGLGDGVVLYDAMARRWLLTEFSSSGNRVCIYVSQTDDPIIGGWFSYEIAAPSFPDYPKYGVWPDAYYVSTNEATSAAYAIDRTAMLAGNPATVQRVAAPNLAGFAFQALNPSDYDGTLLPPVGSPNFFMRHRDDEVHNAGSNDPTRDFLEIWEYSPDFAVPANTTFTGPFSIPVAEFDSTLCGLVSFSCFPMPGTGIQLDPLREVVMFPIQYRNYGTHQVLVSNFVTDVDGTDHGGIRWFELRRIGTGPWSVFQEGTHAPDGDHRFLASNKMDGSGNMAVGYSVTGSTTFPSIRYHGRLAGDPVGTLPGVETSIIAGTASNSSNRWGDYSQMSIDPVDDCTFWYTAQYNASSAWSTRIGSFKFAECGEPGFTLDATNTDQQICSPDSLADMAVTVASVRDFAGPVTLSYVDLPTGFSGSFTPNPVTAPGDSTARLSANASALFGQYRFDITGSAAGVASRQVTATVDVFDSTPATPALATPPDGATGVTSANFSWAAVAQATGYLVQVATDAAFTTIVDSANVSGTSYSGSALAPNMQHFWRVTPSNPCGTGTTSPVFDFMSSLTICSKSGLPISDNATTTDTLNIVTAGTLADLNVSVDLSHTFVGDLVVRLQHLDTGTNVLLIDPGCSGNNFDVVFDDEAAVAAQASCGAGTPAIPTGSYIPATPLSAFDGEALSGSWRLSVTDTATADTGSLNEWCLIPTVATICGDGVVDAGEQCDDGNSTDGDSCSNTCALNIDTNVLTNGDFAAGRSPWVHFTNGAGAFDVVGGEGRLSFTADGSNVQLYQRNIATAGNTEHTLRFRARHNVAGQRIKVRFAKHLPPYTVYGLSSPVRLTTTMETYSINFTTTADDITDARLMFLVSRADVVGSNIFIDDVVLEVTTPDPCGNGVLDPGESCDGGNLGGQTCTGQGFDGGSLACNTTCDGFDTSACFVCGDSVIDGGEVCDGTALGGQTCVNLGFDAGTLDCAADCAAFDTALCTVCGDGTVDPGEQCDDGNTIGGDGCDQGCNLEACGNGIVQSGEECDDGNAVDDDGCSNSCTVNTMANLLVNGDWAGGAGPWVKYSNGSMRYDVVGEEARLTFNSDGTNAQLYQRNVAAASSTEHTLTFRARHTHPGKRITVRFAQHTPPYTFYGMSDRVVLTTTMQTYAISFTTTADVITDGRLMFLVSDADDVPASRLFIDDAVLVPAGPLTCGNDTLDAGETCDDLDLAAQTCGTQGFDGGTLACNATCSGFVTSGCFGCGDGVLNGAELCDGADLGGTTCVTQGFDAGTLACSATCDAFVTSLCSTCGDGSLDGGEQCDDGNTIGGDGCSATCRTEGGTGSNLAANGDFSAGTAGWFFATNAGSSFSVVGGAGFVDINTAGTSVQLYQRDIRLQGGRTYRLTFRGRNTGGNDVRMRVIRHSSPFTNYGLNRVVNLTPTMQTFTMTFTTPGGSLAAARLQFWIAPFDADGNDYFFDDIVLEEQ